MYDKNYEDYMRMTLGYNSLDDYNMFQDDYNMYENSNNDLEQLYPEVYKIMYPMICKACMDVRGPITDDLLTEITNEIYFNFEDDNALDKENRNEQTKGNIKNNSTYSKNTDEPVREDRAQNYLLKDLIRILVLRELLNGSRPGFRPPLRPQPVPPGRPPMGMPPNRPPMRPRMYNDLY